VSCPYECSSFIQRYRIVSLITTALAYLQTFALFAYIAGFTDNRSDLRFYMKRKWNEKGDVLILNGDKDLQNWAYCANQVISNMGENVIHYGADKNDSKLDCLFDEIIRK